MTHIALTTPRGFNPISSLVRRLCKSEVSHAVFVYADADWGVDMVMEAADSGFRIMPLERFEETNTIVAMVEPKQSIEVGLKFVALEYLGTAYDFGGLIGGALVMLGRWLKRKWNNPLENSKALFCSEAVVVALQKSAYPGADALDAKTTTPQDLLTFFGK